MSHVEDTIAPSSQQPLLGQVALVTGSNRGLGRAIASSLIGAGATTICHARTRASAEAAAAELGGIGVWGDLSRETGVRRIADAALAQTSSLNVLVHNAAVNPRPREALAEVERSVFDRAIAVNATAPLFLTQLLAGALRRARPPARIVTVSSHVARMAEGPDGGGYYSYRVSKAALNMITRLLAVDFADAGISVNAVHPGWFRSQMGGADAPRSAEEAAAHIIALVVEASGGSGGLWSEGKRIAW